MSQAPTPYTRQKNFVSDATNNPSITVPQIATGLDSEFVAVQSSLNTTINRLGELQRDDGALRDAIVSAQSLSPTVAALIALQGAVARGAWAAATVYAAGDVVSNGGGTYLCAEAHTANADFTVDQVAGRWLTLEAPYNNSVTTQRYTANGSQVAFSLGVTGTVNVTNVFINGVYQNKDTYGVNGSTLTFGEAPPSGAIVEIVIGSISPVTATVPDLSISTAKLADSSVTSAKIADGAVATAYLADAAVTTAKLADGAITSSKIADGTIATADLADGSVTPAKLSTGGPSWDTSGNVGIGTSSPSTKLEINNTFSADGIRVTVGQGNYSGNVALFGVTGQTNGYQITKDAVNNIEHIWSGTGGAERMRINSSGNVGIGTSSPSAKLQVVKASGADATAALSVSDGNQFLSVLPNASASAYNPLVQAGDALLYYAKSSSSADSGALVIGPWSGSTKGIRIDSTGTISTGGNPITNCKTTAKAWVNFNGTVATPTIRSSYNVSSVTKTGTGVYQVNFTTPMADANFSSAFNTTDDGLAPAICFEGGTHATSRSTSYIKVVCTITANTLTDRSGLNVTIFGN